MVPRVAISLEAPYDYTGELELLVARFNVDVQQRHYDQSLKLAGTLEQARLPALQQALEPVQHKVLLTITAAHR